MSLFFLTTCANSDYTLYLKSEHVGGIDKRISISGHSKTIKIVDAINLLDNEILLKLKVDRDIQIPKGSLFVLYNADFLGTKEIVIIYSDSSELHQDKDTILINKTDFKSLDEISHSVNNIDSLNINPDNLKLMEEISSILKAIGKEDTNNYE